MTSPAIKQLATFAWVAARCAGPAPLDVLEIPMAVGVLRARGAIRGDSAAQMEATPEGFDWAAEMLAPLAGLLALPEMTARLAAAAEAST
ncbi:MAG: hypothetical protein AAF192_10730 [Pseudomonadota bacterium]